MASRVGHGGIRLDAATANRFVLEWLAGVANVRADTDWVLDIEKAMALKPDLILEMSGQEGDPWHAQRLARQHEVVAASELHVACRITRISEDRGCGGRRRRR